MYFNYVIICLSALLVQAIVGLNVGSSICDTGGSAPQLFGIRDLRDNCATISESVIGSGKSKPEECGDFTALTFTLAVEEDESSCDTAPIERFRRASNSNGAMGCGSYTASRCTPNLLKARLGVAAANANAAADKQEELFVPVKSVPVEFFGVPKIVPVPTQLNPPKLLHKQSLSLSPCPVNVPAPSCSCSCFGPGILVSANSIDNTQNFGSPNVSNGTNIINGRCIELLRPIPPKPSTVGSCAVPIRLPDAEEQHTYTNNLAAVVNARIAQHRLLSGQCISAPVPNFISTNSLTISSGGGDFFVTSIGSESAPNIAVDTDVALFGNLNVYGNLPYVSAVQFDGLYDTVGEGSVSFGCDSEPITEDLSINNVIPKTASINICRSPEVPTLQARIQEQQQDSAATAVDAISACFAQHMKSTIQRCPQPVSLPVPSCGCSSGVPCSFPRANYVPVTQKLGTSSNNAAFNSALVKRRKCPELPKPLPSIVTSDVAQKTFGSITEAVSARLAQHKLLAGEQSICEKYPSCVGMIPNCGCSLDGSSNPISNNFIAVPSTGGSLPINSIGSESSPGIAVDTDIDLSGNIDVCGTLPFLSAVEFQGLYDTRGSGTVSFGCGASEQSDSAIPKGRNLDGDNASPKATSINRCRCRDLPRVLPTAVTVPTGVNDIQTGIISVDEQQKTTPLAALVTARLARHRLLTEQQPNSVSSEVPTCGCTNSDKSNFITIPRRNGGLPVTSISPEAPGVDVDADIGLFGKLDVSGDLPFQSAVQFQGLYDTRGSGTVSFGCGD